MLECLTEPWAFAANAYHGARNEAYWVGYSPEGTSLYDLDLVSAYTTAMGLLRVPDWGSARLVTDPAQLAQVDDALTFARVRFCFPEDTRFPSLPWRAGQRGLVYPLSGTSWCTGPELVVALAQGAEITVEAGWRIEWTEADVWPFVEVTGIINRVRAEAKAAGDQVLDKLAKEVGNSAYGKTAQGVELFRMLPDSGAAAQRGKRVFDSRSESMKTLPPSRITNPMLAATITGLVRAVLSEALARLPANAVVMTATTDGLLSSVPVSEMDTTGPLACAFRRARERITPGRDAIWEEKHRAARAIVTKTRGTISITPSDGAAAGRPILARAGFRLGENHADPWAECAAWVVVHRERTYDTVLTGRSLIDLRTQWISDADLIEVPRRTRLNLDFDMKRALVAPRDDEGVLCADTRPWPTVEAFHRARDDLELWKRSQRRVLKTADDYSAMLAWAEEAGPARGRLNSTVGPPCARECLPAGLRCGSPWSGWLELQDAGGLCDPVRLAGDGEHDQGRETARHACPRRCPAPHLGGGAVCLMVFFARPDCELDRFAAEGSPAHATLERLREEASEPAYDDDYVPDQVAPEDWLFEPSADPGLVAVVSGATPPYSASDTLHCKTKSEWR